MCHDLRPKKPTGSDSVSLEEVSSSHLVSINKPRAEVNEGVDQELEPSFRVIFTTHNLPSAQFT